MKILLEDKDNAILLEVAQHLNVELANPKLLYEIGHPALVAVAVALGGVQWFETERQPAPAALAVVEPEAESEDLGRDLDLLPPDETVRVIVKGNGHKPLILAEGVKRCEVCGSQIIGRRAQAKTCSVSCAKEANRRKAVERALTKLREAGAAAESPLA